MSFGFPAYHEETITLNKSKDDFVQDLKSGFKKLNWSIKNESDSEINASNKINFLSWGEKIIIKFLDSNRVSITSKCVLPTQRFDWGKNGKNVNSLLSLLNIK